MIRRRASCAEASWYPMPGESRPKTANSSGSPGTTGRGRA